MVVREKAFEIEGADGMGEMGELIEMDGEHHETGQGPQAIEAGQPMCRHGGWLGRHYGEELMVLHGSPGKGILRRIVEKRQRRGAAQ